MTNDAPPLTLGVLDQSPIPEGATAGQALRATLDLAALTERLGYERYWLAEHHNTLGLAGPAPEVMVAAVAGATSSIRVGSGGVMLSHYSPLKVAEQFQVLEALHPGRIDLGLGRAPGTDPVTAAALRPTHQHEQFPRQLQELIAYLDDGPSTRHPLGRLRAIPRTEGRPELWLLGSSEYSAACAAALGTSFSFADFINPGLGPDVVRGYREQFMSSPELPEPRANVGVAVICGDTEEEALRLASSLGLWRLRLMRGDPGPIPTVEEALAYQPTDAERTQMEAARSRLVVGAPEQVRDQLVALAGRYEVNELIVLTIVHDHAARRHSYELLAEAFDLPAR
jgi:luciferase family oxidoreductase group 1